MDSGPNPPRSDFGRVDQTTNPPGFIEFVDSANALDSVRGCKQAMLRLLALEPGQAVLDVGCGAGDDVLAMASLVGPRGQAVGVDNSAVMIAEARTRRAGQTLPARFEVGEAADLPFAPASFDRCRAERLLLHLEDPAAALRDMQRVLRPGGRVVIFDLDWEGIIVDHPDRTLTRALLQLICDRHRFPWLGRQLPRLFRAIGFTEVGVCPYTIVADYPFFKRICKNVLNQAAELGLAPHDILQEWDADLVRAAQQGSFFASFSGFIVYGTRAAES